MDIDTLNRVWAKTDPYHPLWKHLLDTGAVCEALLPRFGGVDGLPDAWVVYLAAMHDIGKADAWFQAKAHEYPSIVADLHGASLPIAPPEDAKYFRHEIRSFEYLLSSLQSIFDWNRRAAETVARAVHGHHGHFTDVTGKGKRLEWEFPEYQAVWPEIRRSIDALVRACIGLAPFSVDHLAQASVVGIRLSGLIVLADWIASNHETFRYPGLVEIGDPEAYFAAAREEAKRAVSSLGLTGYPRGEPGVTFADVWPKIPGLRPSQKALEDACLGGLAAPGLAIVEAPMGEGKTEAAIYLAEHWAGLTGKTGVYFALPTQATSNQLYSRYSAFLDERRPGAGAVLVHGMSWLLDDRTPLADPELDGERKRESAESRDWFRNTKRALLAPEGVGTVDQALLAALNVKHGFLRLLGLGTKTLIVDEVHAYDDYMTVILQRALRWCRELSIPVILLSATLSSGQKAKLVDAYTGKTGALPPGEASASYPLLTFAPIEGGAVEIPVDTGDSPSRRLRLQAMAGMLDDEEGIAGLAADLVREGGCAAVLVNTVKKAQEVYAALKQMNPPGTELLLFHARYRAERRVEIEEEILRRFGKAAGKDRPERAIVVATQVIEQSLDVDFDVMISQIAPVDLLLQRSGRVWRHRTPEGGELHRRWGFAGPGLYLLLPENGEFEFGSTGKVYGDNPEALLRTLALLRDLEEITLPADFRPLVEGCYGDASYPPRIIPDEVMTAAVAGKAEHLAFAESRAQTHLIPEPSPRSFEYGQQLPAVGELEEGESTSYFRAQTRLGNDSVSLLALTTDHLIQSFKQLAALPEDAHPDRRTLKALFLQKVSVPRWWLTGLKPAPGYEALLPDTPKWLRRTPVLLMPGGRWEGAKDGKPIAILDDREVGMRFLAGDLLADDDTGSAQ